MDNGEHVQSIVEVDLNPEVVHVAILFQKMKGAIVLDLILKKEGAILIYVLVSVLAMNTKFHVYH